MIPEFPQFKKLELADKNDIENFTHKFPPYSDFNFINMWAWDFNGEMGFSILNKNLVVRFTDYVNGELFLSFLGDNMVNETVRSLIEFSEKNFKNNVLKLIPEMIISFLNQSEFKSISDIDSRDYIYSVKHLSDANIWKGHSSSKGIKKFLKFHPDYVVKISSLQDIVKDEYTDLFKKWIKVKNIGDFSKSREYQAFERFLELKDKNIEFVSLYKNGQIIGFTAYEIISIDYAIAHFSKADIKYHSAIYDVLNWEEAKALNKKGIKFYNWEQDLGIENLRKSKEKYKPDMFLNKFIIKSIN